jgi:uncharacterized OsmC-like protein
MQQALAKSASFQATVENRGGAQYFVTTRDAPFTLSTDGHGVSPIDGLLASLAGCVGRHTVAWLAAKEMANPGFTVSASGVLADDRRRLSSISIAIDLGKIPNDAGQRAELLEFAQECPIYGTLRVGCKIGISFV